MNIYFCGIGGVGLGPLAEIALDAGHGVQGSDIAASLMTQSLADRGVAIDFKQDGTFLRQAHAERRIDWFVYSSGVPEDGGELLTARELGLKVSKRDALLAYIIKEKGLKLIAVAGTHGKTTTSAMTVWAFKQLGIPVSYSVGTTMSFGPSGAFDPASQYFVYECDEYDRNFLHFHPYLTLITSLDYDHPDTYPTPEEYLAAFRQFVGQSEFTLLWDKDAAKLDQPQKTWQLGDHDVAALTLPGDHSRRNASLVVKAVEKLGITGDVVRALDRFPGTDRRFERLLPNLYSDYGHHPAEIKATLQLAHEIASDVVLVYQPHQNIRQHEIKDLYTDDVFHDATEIYWLPTYLTREDPTLDILWPQELTRKLTRKDTLHIAELDETLWNNIQQALNRGALVVCMGAGTIDEWVRQQLEAQPSEL